jgi:transcriptional regulator with XRE-family HTH domain
MAVRSIRTEHGMTLADVSEKCGVTVSHLWRLESGERRWNLEVLEKVLRAMRSTMCLVVGDVRPPENTECGCDARADES